MHSSAMMALRGVVLLVCLVAVPLFAVFGKNAPQIVRSFIQDYAGAANNDASKPAASTDPPVFRPGLLAPGSSQATPLVNSSAESGPASANSPALGKPPIPSSAAGTLTPIQPLAGESAGRTASDRFSAVRTASAEIESGGAAAMPRAVRARVTGNEQAISRSRISGSTLEAELPGESAAPPFPANYFHAAEQRLRQLGATYYLLETVGPEGDQYRFLCKVAVSQQREQMLAFVATGSDPLGAMNNVVRQVEGWRGQIRQ